MSDEQVGKSWWDKVYETPVEPEEIVYVVDGVAQAHEEGNDDAGFYTAMAILAERYKHEDHGPGKCVAIMQRIHCLINLMKKNDERMRGWTMGGIEEHCTLTNHAVFSATALCPLKRDEQDLYFDADEFFDTVLKESDSKGRA